MKSTIDRTTFKLAALSLTLSAMSTHATEGPFEGIPTQEVPHEVTLPAIADADVQGGAPRQNYGDHTVMHIGNPDKTVFVQFDLSSLPKAAKITGAKLVMQIVGSGQAPNEVILGKATKNWTESKVTYANQPAIKWSRRSKKISAAGPVEWRVKKAVADWASGTAKNYGFAIRSTGPGAIWAFRSREGAPAASRPALRVAYTTTGGVMDPPRTGNPISSIRGTKLEGPSSQLESNPNSYGKKAIRE